MTKFAANTRKHVMCVPLITQIDAAIKNKNSSSEQIMNHSEPNASNRVSLIT